MKPKEIIVEQFGNRTIVIRGIGKMFYQEGFPISMAVSEFSKNNIEVSVLHVADECLKNGWSAETTFRKIRDDFKDGLEKLNEEQLFKFCNSEYEEQREMIFQYLFGSPSEEFINNKNKRNDSTLTRILGIIQKDEWST